LPITLLAEETRTNLLTYSSTFDNAAWQKLSTATVTPAQAIAPDGALTGYLIDVSGNSVARVVESPNLVAGSYILSVWLRSVSGSGTFRLQLTTNGAGGSTVELYAALTTTWTRFTLSASQTGTGLVGCYIAYRNANTATLNTAYIWGAQLEASTTLSSYIPTTTASLARPADVASFTGSALSNWYNTEQGTFVVNASGNGFRCPSAFGTFNQTFSLPGTYAVQYNNTVKEGSTTLYTLAGGSTPIEYTGITNPITTVNLLNGGLVNMSQFSYYSKALSVSRILRLLT
jgi:hypothetical protein